MSHAPKLTDMERPVFDFDLLLRTYEATCALHGVAPGVQLDEIGAGRCTLTRLRQGGTISVDNVARMVHWMGDTDIGDYIVTP